MRASPTATLGRLARVGLSFATIASTLCAIGCGFVALQFVRDDDESPSTRWTMIIAGVVFAVAFLAGPAAAWAVRTRAGGLLALVALALPFAAFFLWFTLPGL